MSAAPPSPVPGAPASLVSPSALRARSRGMASVVVPPLIVFLAVIGLWFLASYVLITPSKRFLLPPPQDVISVGLLDAHNSAETFGGLWLTTKAALVGFVVAIVIGMSLAILMSQASWIERSIFPYAVVLQTLPILALVPLVGFTIGYAFQSRVLVVVLIALFPVITNTLFGLLSVDQSHHDLFSLHRVSRWTRRVKLQLPAALPAIFTGFRIAAGQAVIGAVVGDFFFKQGEPGIGVLIDVYSSQLESERLYAAVIVASLLGIAVFVVVGFINRLVVGRWHTSTRAG